MYSFYSFLGFWLTIAGIVVSGAMHWFHIPKSSGAKPNRWPLLPLGLAFLAAIVSRYASNGTTASNQARIDSMRTIVSSLDSSKSNLQSQFKIVTDSFGIVKKQLNQLKPLPFTERLRRLLAGISPEILEGLKSGHIEIKIDMTAGDYTKLLDITKEKEAQKYITVKPPASTALNNQVGWVYYGVTLLINPELLSK